MRFAEPGFLWLLSILLPLVLLGWWSHVRRRRHLAAFAGGAAFVGRFDDQVSLNRRAVKHLLLVVAFAGVVLALARPQWGSRVEAVTRQGADVALVLDTSLSMAVEDAAPNRLAYARHAIDNLLGRIEGDRVSLVTFAGQAHLTCPLTVDFAAIRLFLDAVDVDAVPVPGTALADALQLALQSLRDASDGEAARGRVVLLFTDGEDHEGEIEGSLAALTREGVAVYAIGSGTARGGPIPIREGDGRVTSYKEDAQGRVVTSRLDEALLERIALETGGKYYRATTSEVELDEVARALEGLASGEIGSQVRTRFQERFYWPLLVALLALAAEALLPDRRRSGNVVDTLEREVA